MTWTTHGTHIPGSPTAEPFEGPKARCFGIGHGMLSCPTCTREAKEYAAAIEAHQPSEILQFFNYRHLPEALQPYSKLFYDVAIKLDETLKDSPQRKVALEHLLIAKDAAVRSALYLLETKTSS